MSHPLQIIADGMRVVVHGIDAPLIARAVMGGAQNPINYGVAQIDVGRGHVDLRAQTFFAVGVLARLHFAEQGQIFLGRAVPVRALRARLGQRAAGILDFLRRKIADERLALPNQPFGIVVNHVEKVGGVHFLLPRITEPADIVADRVHELRFFLGGVGIVEEQIAGPAVFIRRTEVDEHALRVSDMQIPVRFGRKAGFYRADLALA